MEERVPFGAPVPMPPEFLDSLIAAARSVPNEWPRLTTDQMVVAASIFRRAGLTSAWFYDNIYSNELTFIVERAAYNSGQSDRLDLQLKAAFPRHEVSLGPKRDTAGLIPLFLEEVRTDG
jgi:hypothetical protein